MKLLDRCFFLVIGFTRPIISMFLVYIIYLLLGSLIFVTLETSYEEKSRMNSLENIKVVKDMIKVLRKANYSDSEIYKTFLKMSEIKAKGRDPSLLDWTQLFSDKIFFAFILITTVGYGNVSPKSTLGQAVCVIYTMFGLPIHVIMMRLLSFKFRGGLRKLFKIGQVFSPSSHALLVVLGGVFILFWLGIFIFIPSYGFMIYESWDYIRGVYFSFVSLTTIGLGDYIAGISPGRYDDPFNYLATTGMLLWMFLGLGFVTMAITMLSYVIGVFTLDKLDCKCRKRTEARKKMQKLLDLIKELNWQLVKCKPDDFENWAEIEEFKNFLAENPQDVTSVMLRRLFKICMDLKEKAYDQLSRTQHNPIPMTPIIQQARDDLPEIISRESTTVTFSADAVLECDPGTPVETRRGSLIIVRCTASSNRSSIDKSPSHPGLMQSGQIRSSIDDNQQQIPDLAKKVTVEDKQDLSDNREDESSDHTHTKEDYGGTSKTSEKKHKEKKG